MLPLVREAQRARRGTKPGRIGPEHDSPMTDIGRYDQDAGRGLGLPTQVPSREKLQHDGFFGRGGRRLFGQYFCPPKGESKPLGIVICSPFGFEAVCARRSLQNLAARAAADGFPALCFDYAGCGNSEDGDAGACQIELWTASVQEAIAALKAASGVSTVVLVGLRLGSTLACLASVTRADVAGLVAIAPVVRGRAYLRELRLLGAAGSAAPGPAADADAGLESGGFSMSGKTCSTLSRLDLRKLERAPAPQLLLVERDDLPGLDGWPDSLRAAGAQVEAHSWPGFVVMTDDPRWAKTPTVMFDGILATLRRWSEHADLTGAGATSAPTVFEIETEISSGVPGQTVRERIVRIGGCNGLFGVLTTPGRSERPEGSMQSGVLTCNPGAVHHVGPNRLWVRLARQWAAAGLAVLRIDLSGLGDSPPRDGAQANVIYSPNAAQDIADSLAYLRAEVGVQRNHLLGLCSGGYHMFKAALAGEPVASATMINFFWARGVVHDDALTDYSRILMVDRYWRGIFSLAPWTRLLRGQLNLRTIMSAVLQHLRSLVEHQARELARAFGMRFRQDLATELRSVAERGTRMHFIFSRDDPAHEMLVRQAGSTVRRLREQGALTIEVVTGADHTFTPRASREVLVSLLDATIASECALPRARAAELRAPDGWRA